MLSHQLFCKRSGLPKIDTVCNFTSRLGNIPRTSTQQRRRREEALSSEQEEEEATQGKGTYFIIAVVVRRKRKKEKENEIGCAMNATVMGWEIKISSSKRIIKIPSIISYPLQFPFL